MKLSNVTLTSVLQARAAEHGEKLLVDFGEQQLTYRGLHEDSERLARGLAALGIKPGDNVVIWMPNNAEWLTSFFALARLGARAVPLNTRFRTHELRYVLEQSRSVGLIITDRFLRMNYAHMVSEIWPEKQRVDTEETGENRLSLRFVVAVAQHTPANMLSFDEVLTTGDDAQPMVDALSADSTACIAYTSGTTAFPKGAMLSHSSLIRNAECVSMYWMLEQSDRLFSPFPFYHLAGLTNSFLATLVAGASLYSVAKWDPIEAMSILERHRCSCYVGPATTQMDLLNSPDLTRFDLSTVRLAQATHHETVGRRLHEELGWEISGVYGLTEGAPNVCVGDLRDPVHTRIERGGRPFPGIEVRIVSPSSLVDLPDGEPGEILVRGWNIMAGYYEKPEETAKAIDSDGWLHTGDMGSLDADGYLTYKGRYKDMIKSGGENISTEEIEAVLLRHPKVHQAQVIGIPDDRKGEVPLAFVETKPGRTCTEDEIIDFCRARVANFKIPKTVRFIDSWPLTHIGKIQKFELRKLV